MDFLADLFQVSEGGSVGGLGGADLVFQLLDSTLLGFELLLAQLLLLEVWLGFVDAAAVAFLEL